MLKEIDKRIVVLKRDREAARTRGDTNATYFSGCIDTTEHYQRQIFKHRAEVEAMLREGYFTPEDAINDILKKIDGEDK